MTTNFASVTSVTSAKRLRKAEVCEMLGVSPRTLDNLVSRREFPEGVRIGKWSYWTLRAVERFHERAFAAQENWTPVQTAMRSKTRGRF